MKYEMLSQPHCRKHFKILCAIFNKWKQEFLICMGGFSGWSVFKMFTRPYEQRYGVRFDMSWHFDSRYKIPQLPLSVRNSKMPCASTTCSCFTATVLSNSKWCDMLSENRFSVWALHDNMLRKGLEFITLLHETTEVIIIKNSQNWRAVRSWYTNAAEAQCTLQFCTHE